MKNVIVYKDEYIDNSVRISYIEKDAIFKRTVLQLNEETGTPEKTEITEVKDKLLFCERLIWNYSEEELDSLIEEHRKDWEKKINS